MAIKILPEEENFKKILEYFVRHMLVICENISNNQDINETACIDEKSPKFNKLIINEGCLSGQGYKKQDSGIQAFMEKNTDVQGVNNSFSCMQNGDQKICISVDATGGYKASYLHLVSRDISKSEKNEKKKEPMGTDIIPLFKQVPNSAGIKEYVFWGLAVGPGKGSTYVFPRLDSSFEELGLGSQSPTEQQKFNLNTFFKYFIEMRKQELMGSLTYRGMNQLVATHNMILTGAPGTGKTWSAKNIASWMICGLPYEKLTKKEFKDTYKTQNEDFKKRCKVVQFHPSYDYTDFVEGLRPTSGDNTANNADNTDNTESAAKATQVGFERVDGVFKAFCANAATEEEISYVFIIDEINRGELSKIFGELFYSIDPGYRGEDGRVDTQYQNMIPDGDTFKSGFYVPDNVYVIGTMNDIDRSVESMDFAMRRRFSFIEVKANERMDMWTEDWKDLAEACMKAINKEIESLPGLSSAYHIGPAYFKKLNNYMEQQGDDYPNFFKLWDNHLHGVIFDYLRGKKDAEKTMIKIQEKFLNGLIKAVKQRFNNGGKWGSLLIDKYAGAKAIDPSINDEDSAKMYLDKMRKNIQVLNIDIQSLYSKEIEAKTIPEREAMMIERASLLLKLNRQIEYVMSIGSKIEELSNNSNNQSGNNASNNFNNVANVNE